MGFNFMDESTQEFPSPSPFAGSVAFLFRDTTSQDLYTTMRSLGASPDKLGAGWLLPVSGQPLLEIRLIEDVLDYAIDLIWEAWKFYVPLLDALGVNEENALIIDVRVRNDVSAREALRTFTLTMLHNHAGVVRDSNTEHAWTREEIANNSIRSGRTFFGEGDAVAGGAATA